MKSWFLAVAAAPLAMACTIASAEDNPRQEAVGPLITFHSESGPHVRARIAFDAGDGQGVRRHVINGNLDEMTEEERAEFEDAMEALRSALGTLQEHRLAFAEDGERLRDMTLRLHREAGAMREHGDRMRTWAEAQGHRAHWLGLRAGADGMEAGVAGLDRALRRGWVYEDGERRELTDAERAQLESARADLVEQLEAFRAEHADALALIERDEAGPHAMFGDGLDVFDLSELLTGRDAGGNADLSWHSDDGESRRLRVERRDGQTRVWVNGEELEGDALEDWMAEHDELPTPPEPPSPPAQPR